MGVREYARHRGVTQASVTDAINQGRISDAIVRKNGTRKIIQEKADELWAANTIAPDGSTNSGKGLIKARAAKEAYAAKIAQLKYEQQSGKLCRVEDVKRAASSTARITRDTLLNLPDRLAPILASESDLHVIRELLTKEISECLHNLSQINWDHIMERGMEK